MIKIINTTPLIDFSLFFKKKKKKKKSIDEVIMIVNMFWEFL
jgi:hypothetical protein